MSAETWDVEALTSILLDAWRTVTAKETNMEWATRVSRMILASDWLAEHDTEVRAEPIGLLNDLVTAKKLRLDAEEWQLVWDRVFALLARAGGAR